MTEKRQNAQYYANTVLAETSDLTSYILFLKMSIDSRQSCQAICKRI